MAADTHPLDLLNSVKDLLSEVQLNAAKVLCTADAAALQRHAEYLRAGYGGGAKELAKFEAVKWRGRQRIADGKRLSPRAQQWLAYAAEHRGGELRVADISVVEALAQRDWESSGEAVRRMLQQYRVEPIDRPYTVEGMERAAGVPSEATGLNSVEDARALLHATEADIAAERERHQVVVARCDYKESRIRRLGARLEKVPNCMFVLVPVLYLFLIAFGQGGAPAWVDLLIGLSGVVVFAPLAAVVTLIVLSGLLPKQLHQSKRRLEALEPLGMHESALLLGCLEASPIARAWHYQVVAVSQRQLMNQDLSVIRALMTPAEIAAASAG